MHIFIFVHSVCVFFAKQGLYDYNNDINNDYLYDAVTWQTMLHSRADSLIQASILLRSVNWIPVLAGG